MMVWRFGLIDNYLTAFRDRAGEPVAKDPAVRSEHRAAACYVRGRAPSVFPCCGSCCLVDLENLSILWSSLLACTPAMRIWFKISLC